MSGSAEDAGDQEAALRAKARDSSIEELVTFVRDEAQEFQRTILSATDSPGAREIAQHGASVGISVAREVLHVALTGELPSDEDADIGGRPEVVAARYWQAVESCIAHVESAEPDAFLDVTWAHPAFGPMNWREWFTVMAFDARDHVVRLHENQ